MYKYYFVLICFFGFLGCSDSTTDDSSINNSIIGVWESDCVDINEVSFPNMLGFINGFAIIELDIDESNITANYKFHDSESCNNQVNEFVGFEGQYQKVTNSSNNEIFVTGNLSNFVSVANPIYYSVERDLLYFSTIFMEPPEINFDYVYHRK